MPTKPPRHGQPRRPRHAHHYARPEELREFYSSARWTKLSADYRREFPLCADPHGLHPDIATPAVDVHHRIPLRVNLALGLDRANLMSLCRACHDRIDAAIRTQGTRSPQAIRLHQINAGDVSAMRGTTATMSGSGASTVDCGGVK